MIQNIRNNRVYIGQTTNINRRIRDHKRMLADNKHTNKNLQKDYNSYDIIDFEYVILENNIPKYDLLEREKYWIDYYGGIETYETYNMTTYQHINKQVKNFISEGNKGKIRTQDYKDNMSNMKNLFYDKNNNVKQKISNSLKIYYNTEDGIVSKSHLSERAKLNYKGVNNPMYGKKHTNKSKALMSVNKKGSVPWNKGKSGLYKTSEETKQKLRLASTKYNKEFIEELKSSYIKLGTYTAVAQKYNLNTNCVSRLIRYGSTKIPSKICND